MQRSAIRLVVFALVASVSATAQTAPGVVVPVIDEGCVSELTAQCVGVLSNAASHHTRVWRCALGTPPLEGKTDPEKDALRRALWVDCGASAGTYPASKPQDEIEAILTATRLHALSQSQPLKTAFADHGPTCRAFAQSVAHRSCRRTISFIDGAGLADVKTAVGGVETKLDVLNQQLQANFIKALVCAFSTDPEAKKAACGP